jgi:pyruvate/2-oxoglutarate dehydrogenase complex dihydrolipoamide dehydrogenase (E3) component
MVAHRRNLARRSIADLEATGMVLRLGTTAITIRVTGDRGTGRLLGMQLFGHRHAEIAKRIDIAATAIYHNMTVDAVSDLDLSYTPPLGSPWEAVQMGAQAWVRATRRR